MYLFGITEALKLAIAYFLVLIFIPSLILRNRLKQEEMLKRFMMYLVFGNIYVSTIVFTLSYLQLFNRLSLFVSFFILSFLLYMIVNYKDLFERILRTKEKTKEILLSEYGLRLFLSDVIKGRIKYIQNIYNEVFAENKIEWVLFLAIIFYNVYQYGINSVEYTTYMAPDEEVHLYWIQSLIQGNIFPSGVYPHIFHTILAALVKLFKFNAMSVILYFGMTSVVLIMTTLYIGLRKVFHSKYAALLGLLLYSTLDLFIEHATYRYQFTIPQEYGMIMLIPMALFLFAYIKDQKKRDLLFFGLALALTVGIHPYTGAIAFILAVAIGLVYLYKIIKEKILFKLILTGLLSVVIAIAPLAIGLAAGQELEQSFAWGSEVIKGDVYSTTSEGVPKEEIEEVEPLGFDGFISGAKLDLSKYVIPNLKEMGLLLFLILFSASYNLYALYKHKDDEKHKYQLAFTLNQFLLLLLILFKALGLPTIMEPKRITIYFAYFSAVFLGMPLELLSNLLKQTKLKKAIPGLSLGIIGLSLLMIINFDLLRPLPSLYYFQPSGIMRANMEIIDEYEDETWTAISPVNNISSVLNHGYHYELDEFIFEQENWNPEKVINIPTENVFLYVEKRPIIKYGDDFHRGDYELKNRMLITREEAFMDFTESTAEHYHYKNERNQLMAKAYVWAEEYQNYFPKEISTYYEDSELIVYHIKQSGYALNNLNINYEVNSR